MSDEILVNYYLKRPIWDLAWLSAQDGVLATQQKRIFVWFCFVYFKCFVMFPATYQQVAIRRKRHPPMVET